MVIVQIVLVILVIALVAAVLIDHFRSMEIRQETDMYETIVKPAIIPILTEGWCKEPLATFKALPTTIPPVLFILNYYRTTKVGSVIYLSKTVIVNYHNHL
jgi:hypothetical protein